MRAGTSDPVLVTGAAGAIGRVVVDGLRAAGHRVRGFDRWLVTGDPDHRSGDLTDGRAVDAAVAGCSAVVHLGAVPDVAPFIDHLMPTNIGGSYHVLEACLRHGIERVILASTLRVRERGHAAEGPLAGDRDYGPRDLYAYSKVCVEEMGRMYATTRGLRVIAARLGWFPRDAREARAIEERGLQRFFLGRGDVVDFVAAALTSGRPGFGAYYVFSADADREQFDLDAAERDLGYVARQRYPEGGPS